MDEHLEYVEAKSWKRLNVMRKLKFKLDRKLLQIIYLSFVRPLLEYASVVWNNCTQYEASEQKQIPKNEAARIVTALKEITSQTA